ncbi:hypothetical protein F5Y11DRAFT_364341 [Daldinia sp. FL1419]|nr:hypothetical protein F5Y11DRAFT_364341 [Daldinia sp. FL1419]
MSPPPGSCGCMGMMGPGLGGGRGRHEGCYGTISDNILQPNVVLADGGKPEDIFTALSIFHCNGSTPIEFAFNFGNFQTNTTLDDKAPVIFWTFSYCRSAEDVEKQLAAFNAIEAFYEESGDVSYPEISVAQGSAESGLLCQENIIRIAATAGLEDGFKNLFITAGGGILHEGFSTAAVTAINSDNSVYPFRASHHLMLFQTTIPRNNQEIEKTAW